MVTCCCEYRNWLLLTIRTDQPDVCAGLGMVLVEGEPLVVGRLSDEELLLGPAETELQLTLREPGGARAAKRFLKYLMIRFMMLPPGDCWIC